MQFLTKDDFLSRLHPDVLAQITGGDDTKMEAPEADAIGTVTDMLSGMYDIATELAKTGSERHNSLRQWTLALALYFLYAHIPDNEVPERIIKDYDDTLQTLSEVAKGKRPTTLIPVTDAEGNEKRFIRYGFNPKRSHKML